MLIKGQTCVSTWRLPCATSPSIPFLAPNREAHIVDAPLSLPIIVCPPSLAPPLVGRSLTVVSPFARSGRHTSSMDELANLVVAPFDIVAHVPKPTTDKPILTKVCSHFPLFHFLA